MSTDTTDELMLILWLKLFFTFLLRKVYQFLDWNCFDWFDDTLVDTFEKFYDQSEKSIKKINSNVIKVSWYFLRGNLCNIKAL